ncbi:hypothetical protein [Streptomyces noursei]|uniref:hypothetical protein n=1 Tax=Streptomyces noursei TaxID=1971 RepID=UPI0016749559|nr:hypothetical protein [Streptomyces noursei]MCZ1019850.1 hypothetical protein [Streptomyces noursei]GGX36256.1 hypothetical protein GCM10010341_67100 [Streptomyces noursei]
MIDVERILVLAQLPARVRPSRERDAARMAALAGAESAPATPVAWSAARCTEGAHRATTDQVEGDAAQTCAASPIQPGYSSAPQASIPVAVRAWRECGGQE